MKIFITILVFIALIVAGSYLFFDQESEDKTSTTNTSTDIVINEAISSTDEKTMEITVEEETAMLLMTYDHSGDLMDVSGGSATGIAQAIYTDNTYKLLATSENLPIPSSTDFYEGWIVRKDPIDVISTGKADLEGGNYINLYESSQNLTDHDFYVLTLEPDDGDPAPAEHVLEGTLLFK